MPPSNLREIVLRAAVDHIAEHGPDSLSFRQIAAAAGVSHQAPYHHFTDRKGIFRAIAVEGYEVFTAMLRAADATDDGDDPSTAMLEAYVEFALTHRGHFRVMFRSELSGLTDDPESREIADQAFDVLLEHVRRLLGDDATVDDIRTRASAMWALAHGLATLLIDGPLEVKVGPIVDRKALVRAVAEHSGLAGERHAIR
jgi:AcrR family transcriptional regulator